MKILLAVDGSDYTRRMLDYVASNTALFDASHEYTLFNAQPQLPGHAASVVGGDAVRQYHEDEAKQVLDPALATLSGRGLKASATWKAGPAGETIGEFAEQGGYGLVIMGSHGHGALGRIVMGSVANRVLAHCSVPVLLIR
ncbi:MAG TPA: universal stress protein [Ramlibacter sp.]|nr:universal stress protein [Ramlibacter sp.]